MSAAEGHQHSANADRSSSSATTAPTRGPDRTPQPEIRNTKQPEQDREPDDGGRISLHPPPTFQQQTSKTLLSHSIMRYTSVDNECARTKTSRYILEGNHQSSRASTRQLGLNVNRGSQATGGVEIGDPITVTRSRVQQPSSQTYVVVGMSRPDSVPQERLIILGPRRKLFTSIFWAIVRMRGISAFLSLKDVQQFRIYKVQFVPNFSLPPYP